MVEFRQPEFGNLNFDNVERPLEFWQLSNFQWNLDNCRTSIGSSITLSNFHNWRKSYGISTTIYFAGLFIVDFSKEFWQHVLFMSVFLPNFRCRISKLYIIQCCLSLQRSGENSACYLNINIRIYLSISEWHNPSFSNIE